MTRLNLYLNIDTFTDVLLNQGLVLQDCTGPQLKAYINGKEIIGKENLIEYLSDPENFNAFIEGNEQVCTMILNQAFLRLKHATSLILATSNGIINGLLTCLKILQEQKFTKYISRKSSCARFNIPYVQ